MTYATQAETLDQFENLVRSRDRGRTMVTLIVDSPWLPGYAGVSTTDFFFDQTVWFDTYKKAAKDLNGAALLPGAWFELGMVAEPSGWGVPIRWSAQQPPDVSRFPGDLAALVARDVPDPETDGLMPLILGNYERFAPQLRELGMPPRIAAARGPLAVAGHLCGMNELLMASQLERETCLELLEKTTELCIRWLECQLSRMDRPLGVLVLDDLVGMMGPDDAAVLATPFLKRIFERFPNLLHLFHNDTPNEKVFPSLVDVGIDVFNFSHKIDVRRSRILLGDDMVLMGNLPPLDLLVNGTPDRVYEATKELVRAAAEAGPIVVSPGGGVSPGTPIENLQAVVEAVGDGLIPPAA